MNVAYHGFTRTGNDTVNDSWSLSIGVPDASGRYVLVNAASYPSPGWVYLFG